MGLQLYGLQVWCWLISTVLWLVVVERQLDLSSMTARLRGGSCVVLSGLVEVLPVVVCPGGGTILVVDPWWYLVVVVPSGVEVDWCFVEVIVRFTKCLLTGISFFAIATAATWAAAAATTAVAAATTATTVVVAATTAATTAAAAAASTAATMMAVVAAATTVTLIVV
ncbi:hypothetical protein Taro_015943 [Colocasia esculenta]|uniref:Uncharacterized protein n=1 Tax=Colocasia esculenta TaxID=4460 RepID=A0A843UNS4_COLES|nr:hypothetical protein [Colocasia esculenta]